jgi:hypothetical protein
VEAVDKYNLAAFCVAGQRHVAANGPPDVAITVASAKKGGRRREEDTGGGLTGTQAI